MQHFLVIFLFKKYYPVIKKKITWYLVSYIEKDFFPCADGSVDKSSS